MCLIRCTEDVETIICIFIANKVNKEAKASEINLCLSMRNKC
jgi:hypothetical protein